MAAPDHSRPVIVAGTQSTPRDRLARALFVVAGLLLAASLAGQVSTQMFHHDHLKGLVPLFDVDAEYNVPAWFQSMVLAGNAVLAGLVAWSLARRDPVAWRLGMMFAALLAFASLDEMVLFHERARFALAGQEEATNSFWDFSWIVPGALLALLFAVTFVIRFLRRLPPPAARRIKWALVIYLCGTLVMELLGGLWVVWFGRPSPGYTLANTIEEGLEMTGQILLADGLLLALTLLGVRLVIPRSPRTGD